MPRHSCLLLTPLFGLACWPGQAAERHNWFDEPIVQLSSDLPNCPAPDGPLLTEEQMRAQAHDRIERGTSCYLAHQCRYANSYTYDPEIAAAAQARLQDKPTLRGSTLWLTVQRRFVRIEGCAASQHQLDELAQALRSTPDVQQVEIYAHVRRR
ncbi:BON domain-containing protein [Neisseriaceae bacterium JH1-16]|nr:BON domain-containing protein [Neisseriaceae bacterium JH1-16]